MLRLIEVTRSYGARVAVDALTLSVRRGEIFGLLGPNGAGKTTTVSMCVGLLKPTAGSIGIEGWGLPSLAATRAHIGLAPQSLAIYDLLSGLENLRFFAELQGLTGAERDRRVTWALDFVGLTERALDRVAIYSGGMKRRLDLAAAILQRPELLFLDEPTVGVDPQSRNTLFENILALREAGATIVYTTHYMEEVERLCDRVAIMDHGRMLALGTVRDLAEQHGGPSVLVLESAAGVERLETSDPVGELARRNAEGVALSGFRWERPSLEQVFLRLTGRSLRD